MTTAQIPLPTPAVSNSSGAANASVGCTACTAEDLDNIAASLLDAAEVDGPPLVRETDTALVAEAPWSVAEWAVAPRFDNPRATVLVLVLG